MSRILILGLMLLVSPAHATELKLATWNIAWLTARSAELPRDRAQRRAGDLDLLAGYAQRLDADILALQEVDGPEAAARVVDPRAYAFFFPAEDDLQRAGFAVRRGLRVTQHGDFNRAMTSPNEELWRLLAAAAPLVRVTEGVSNPCWSGARGGRSFIDHIMLGGPARDWLVPESLRVLIYAERTPDYRDRLSDHCPVSLRLRLP